MGIPNKIYLYKGVVHDIHMTYVWQFYKTRADFIASGVLARAFAGKTRMVARLRVSRWADVRPRALRVFRAF